MAAVMRKILCSKPEIKIFNPNKGIYLECKRCFAKKDSDNPSTKKEFRVLQLYPSLEPTKKAKKPAVRNLPPGRAGSLTPDDDWTSIWPGPMTYTPHVVPLPLRQGINRHGSPPDRFANTELMKIPNFLHLTPPAIEKHCKAIKKFCTEWPENLKTDEEIEKQFPIEIISSDYCHSSPSIRDPKARIISLKVKLKNLELDEHAKDKLLRLVGPRYDPKTDYITITTDSCPLKKQNYDYVHYLLTALYFESWKFENWEKEKSDDDMEKYIFSKRQSLKSLQATFSYNQRSLPDDLEDFGKAVEDWHNKGDDRTIIENYKRVALELLSLPRLEASS